MFGMGLPEIIIILVIFFVLFGAKRLPQIGEGLGKTMKELRKIRGEKKTEKETEKEAEKETEKGNQKGNVISDLRKEVEGIPGLKEVRELKEAADKVKTLTKFLK